ncbi:diguanylate cyclase [Roseateles sp. BYS180W]|uniref:diguanylate cyclase n=1 Tax=Roseateles rivi TaxID=3299028 RepID=A0ABW7FQZ1_9BURK
MFDLPARESLPPQGACAEPPLHPSETAGVSASPSAEAALPSLRVLVVDDQASLRALLKAQLSAAGHEVTLADGGAQALDAFKRYRPDVVLLDVHMPVHDGYWVAARLREIEQERGAWTPIIFLSALGQDHDLQKGIACGGDDYLIKPVSLVVLKSKLRAMQRIRLLQGQLLTVSDELRRSNAKLLRLSMEDGLTGLVNRRTLDERLRHEVLEVQRTGRPLSLLLCDIDHFKNYNDTLGHQAGDECLRQVARYLLTSCLRPNDLAARYGGEEFALVLPNTPHGGALAWAHALRKTLADTPLEHPASPVAPHVTLSCGVTTLRADQSASPELLLQRADEALYHAKELGRNRYYSADLQRDGLTLGEQELARFD